MGRRPRRGVMQCRGGRRFEVHSPYAMVAHVTRPLPGECGAALMVMAVDKGHEPPVELFVRYAEANRARVERIRAGVVRYGSRGLT